MGRHLLKRKQQEQKVGVETSLPPPRPQKSTPLILIVLTPILHPAIIILVVFIQVITKNGLN